MEVDKVVEVVQPGDKLNKILGINDFIAAPLVLLFYPEMDEEILEIIQQKEIFGPAHIAFISKEILDIPGSNTIWFIKDDEQETIFKAFDVVGNNIKAAFWVEEDGTISTKIQQLTNMKFLLENLIPGYLDRKTQMEDEAMNEDPEREKGNFPWKSEPNINS